MSIAPTSTTYFNFNSLEPPRNAARPTLTVAPADKSLPQTQPIEKTLVEEMGFDDFLDIINPLQHLPVIGWAYRKITGDTINPIPAMIGGTLFGGGIGLLTSAIQEVLIDRESRQETQTDLAQSSTLNTNPIDHLLSRLFDVATPALGSKTDRTRDADPTPPVTPEIATLRYIPFDREQTAGSIAVYG